MNDLDAGADAALAPTTASATAIQTAAKESATQGAPPPVVKALANGAAVASGATPPEPAPTGHAAVATLSTAAAASAAQGDHPAVTSTLASAAAVATPGAVPALKAAANAASAQNAPPAVVAALKNEHAAALGNPPPLPAPSGPHAAATLVQATNDAASSGAHPAVVATLAKNAVLADPKIASGAATPMAQIPGAPDAPHPASGPPVMPPAVTSSGAPPSPPQGLPPPPPALAALPPKQVQGVIAGVLGHMTEHPSTALESGESLSPGQYIASHKREAGHPRFKLVFQNDGDLVLYHHVTPIWASHTRGLGGARVKMCEDGNLKMTSASGDVLWSTGTKSPGAMAVLEDNGNFVVYDAEGDRALWGSHQEHLSRGLGLDRVGNVFTGGARGGSFGVEGQIERKERYGRLYRRMGEAMHRVLPPSHRRGWELAMHTSSGLYSPEEIARTLARYDDDERAGFAAGVAMKKGMTHPDFPAHLAGLGAPREASLFGWDPRRREERERWMRERPGVPWPGEYEDGYTAVQLPGMAAVFDPNYQAQAAADVAAGITPPPAFGPSGAPITDPGAVAYVPNPPYQHLGYGYRGGGRFHGGMRGGFGADFGAAYREQRRFAGGARGPGERRERLIRGQRVRALNDPYAFPDGRRARMPGDGFHNWGHRAQWEMAQRFAWRRANPGWRSPAGGVWPEPSTLQNDQQIGVGQSLYSPTGNVRLTLQADGNLVMYDANANPIWASNTVGSGAAYAVQQMSDGNFVVYNAGNAPVWASGVTQPSAQLRVQDDGNLVIYSQSGGPLWATNTSTSVTNPALQVQVALNGAGPSVAVATPNLQPFVQGGPPPSDWRARRDWRLAHQGPYGQPPVVVVNPSPTAVAPTYPGLGAVNTGPIAPSADTAALDAMPADGTDPSGGGGAGTVDAGWDVPFLHRDYWGRPHWWNNARAREEAVIVADEGAIPAYDAIAAQDIAQGITPPPTTTAGGDPILVPFVYPDGVIVNPPPQGFPDWNARARWERARRIEWLRLHPGAAPIPEPSLVAPFYYPDGTIVVLPPEGFHDWNERQRWEAERRRDWGMHHPDRPMRPTPPAAPPGWRPPADHGGHGGGGGGGGRGGYGPSPGPHAGGSGGGGGGGGGRGAGGGGGYGPSPGPGTGSGSGSGSGGSGSHAGSGGGGGSGGGSGEGGGSHGGSHGGGGSGGGSGGGGGTPSPSPGPTGGGSGGGPRSKTAQPVPPHVYEPGAGARLAAAAQDNTMADGHPAVTAALQNAAAIGQGRPQPRPAPVGPSAAAALSEAAERSASTGAGHPAVTAALGTAAAHAASVPVDPPPGHVALDGGAHAGSRMHGELTVTHGDVTFKHRGSSMGLDGSDGGFSYRRASGDFPSYLPDQGRRTYGDFGMDMAERAKLHRAVLEYQHAIDACYEALNGKPGAWQRKYAASFGAPTQTVLVTLQQRKEAVEARLRAAGLNVHGFEAADGGYSYRHESGDFPSYLPDQGRRTYGDFGHDFGYGEYPRPKPPGFGVDSPEAVQEAKTLQAAGVAIGLGSSLLGKKAQGDALDTAALHPHTLDGMIRTGYGTIVHWLKVGWYRLRHPTKKSRMPDGSVVTTLAPIKIVGHPESPDAAAQGSSPPRPALPRGAA
jgi:hypothetical protein